MKNTAAFLVYRLKGGEIELRQDVAGDNVWASQAQIAKLFEIDQSVASRHIKNIFQSREINEKSNMQKMHNANSDKPISFYSLDVILAVGYRTNSGAATEFRKWVTKVLRSYIDEGFAVNKKKLVKNYWGFSSALQDVKLLLEEEKISASGAMDLVSVFARTWLSLDAYDKGELVLKGVTKRKIFFKAKNLEKGIADLKANLIAKGEATENFAREKAAGVLQGIVGNVMQSFDGEDLYKTLEEKAAHLFYFVVKDHPFIDGNKRSGAFAFAWFLQKYDLLDIEKISP
jgi:prophage maintenance system killer protein/prophage antirepressor-like protein